MIIDFCDLPIFDATTYPSILLLEKRIPDAKEEALAATFTRTEQLERLEERLEKIGFPMPVTSLKSEGWNLARPEVLALMEKLRSVGTPLGEYVQGRFYRGITTGLNRVFVVDYAMRNQLINEHSSSAELLKPFLRGKDGKRWRVNFADYYLVKIESSENKQHLWSGKTKQEAETIFKMAYPAIYNHFKEFRDQLIKRDDQGKYYWELRSCAYWNEFEQPKIILGRFMNKATFAFDKNSFFHNDALYMIPGASEYIVAVLNSTISWWFLAQICTDLQNGYLQAFREDLFQIPIPNASASEQASIIDHVRHILANPDGTEVPLIEEEINRMVYDVYGLREEEIEIVKRKL